MLCYVYELCIALNILSVKTSILVTLHSHGESLCSVTDYFTQVMNEYVENHAINGQLNVIDREPLVHFIIHNWFVWSPDP